MSNDERRAEEKTDAKKKLLFGEDMNGSTEESLGLVGVPTAQQLGDERIDNTYTHTHIIVNRFVDKMAWKQ